MLLEISMSNKWGGYVNHFLYCWGLKTISPQTTDFVRLIENPTGNSSMENVIWLPYNLGNPNSYWLYVDAAGKPQRLETTLQVINHGFYKVLENSEAMPAYLFQVGATLGVRLIVDCPGTVLTAQEERPSCDERIWSSYPEPRMAGTWPEWTLRNGRPSCFLAFTCHY